MHSLGFYFATDLRAGAEPFMTRPLILSSKVYFAVDITHWDCGTWMAIEGLMTVWGSSAGFMTAREVTNAQGQFHDTVQECCRYFKSQWAARWRWRQQVVAQIGQIRLVVAIKKLLGAGLFYFLYFLECLHIMKCGKDQICQLKTQELIFSLHLPKIDVYFFRFVN